MWSYTGLCNKISSQNCVIWFSSFLQGDGRKCEDIDECAILNGCDPRYGVCENSVGSYICRCKAGFERKNNSNECIGQWHDILLNWNKSFHHFLNIFNEKEFWIMKNILIKSITKKGKLYVFFNKLMMLIYRQLWLKIKTIQSVVYVMSNCVQASRLWSNNMRNRSWNSVFFSKMSFFICILMFRSYRKKVLHVSLHVYISQ